MLYYNVNTRNFMPRYFMNELDRIELSTINGGWSKVLKFGTSYVGGKILDAGVDAVKTELSKPVYEQPYYLKQYGYSKYAYK